MLFYSHLFFFTFLYLLLLFSSCMFYILLFLDFILFMYVLLPSFYSFSLLLFYSHVSFYFPLFITPILFIVFLLPSSINSILFTTFFYLPLFITSILFTCILLPATVMFFLPFCILFGYCFTWFESLTFIDVELDQRRLGHHTGHCGHAFGSSCSRIEIYFGSRAGLLCLAEQIRAHLSRVHVPQYVPCPATGSVPPEPVRTPVPVQNIQYPSVQR